MSEKIEIDETIFAAMAVNYYTKYIERSYSPEAIQLSGLDMTEFIIGLGMSPELYDIFTQNLATSLSNAINMMTGADDYSASVLPHEYRKHIPGLQELHEWLEECEELLVDEELKLRLEDARTLLESNGYIVEEDY